MAKKDNPFLFFRREWWDSLRHKSPELFKETLTLLFSTFFDGKDFDPYSFDEQGSNPSPAEDLAIPMIKITISDREAYIAKCNKLSANAKKQNQMQANADKCEQMLANASKCEQMRVNRKEKKGKERNINEIIFSSASRSSLDEKKELLFSLALYFLSNGHTKAMTEATLAYDYNESQNWVEHKANGRDIDHSKDKLSYAKNWKCSKGASVSPAHGTLFADLCEAVSLDSQNVLDCFSGIIPAKGTAKFCFTNKDAADSFNDYFKNNEERLSLAGAILEKYDFNQFQANYEK